MTRVMSLEDRGRVFEHKFALDKETEFKIEAKTNRLVAQWAADRIGLDEHQSAKYITELDSLILVPNGKSLVKKKLMADFSTNSIDISDHALEKLFSLKADQARKQFFRETAH